MIRPDDHIAQADYDLTPARHRRDIAPAGVAHQAAIDRSRQRRVAAMGRVLALNVSHNGHALADGANFGKLGLISRLACVRGWALTLHRRLSLAERRVKTGCGRSHRLHQRLLSTERVIDFGLQPAS